MAHLLFSCPFHWQPRPSSDSLPHVFRKLPEQLRNSCDGKGKNKTKTWTKNHAEATPTPYQKSIKAEPETYKDNPKTTSET